MINFINKNLQTTVFFLQNVSGSLKYLKQHCTQVKMLFPLQGEEGNADVELTDTPLFQLPSFTGKTLKFLGSLHTDFERQCISCQKHYLLYFRILAVLIGVNSICELH